MDFFNCHTHKASKTPNVLDLVNQYPKEFDTEVAFYSIGIHPWYIEKERVEIDLKIIEEKIQTKNCLAIGECGLDKRIEIPFDLQEVVFEKQLLLAQKYQKPVVIHCVAAFQEIIALKNKFKITVPLIIHGFSKKEQIAKQLLENEFYLSFGRYLLRNSELRLVFQNIPNTRFFLETDSIEETIEEVYNLAAHYKNLSLKEIQTIISNNYQHVFK